jgi:hypothetical protein
MRTTLLDYAKYLVALSIACIVIVIVMGSAGYLTFFGLIDLTTIYGASQLLFSIAVFLALWFLADYTRER